MFNQSIISNQNYSFSSLFFRTEWWRYESASNQNYIWTIISEERYFWCKVKSRSILLPIFIFLMLLFVAWTSQRCDHTILKLCFVTIHMNWKSQTILVPSVETLGLFSFVESFVQRHGLYHSSFNILIIITECAHAGETYWQKKRNSIHLVVCVRNIVEKFEKFTVS